MIIDIRPAYYYEILDNAIVISDKQIPGRMSVPRAIRIVLREIKQTLPNLEQYIILYHNTQGFFGTYDHVIVTPQGKYKNISPLKESNLLCSIELAKSSQIT